MQLDPAVLLGQIQQDYPIEFKLAEQAAIIAMQQREIDRLTALAQAAQPAFNGFEEHRE
ncbi:hypothetical protein AMIS_20690 [Actinoplanes missouriensis 431]|uniref:Uncharacterized protein n=1 Tax=Actinoplanes missouriensis (strain ATCC 14538 / DSM 43046 / CBS 188.64 / JCM 3121 / NBRC 102363 / NCIMB 12654 / NRRL B-3342 / UNCC 431) TaxID=512565 RepID=I0H2Q2_ACTM4|nr:hypothetical protein [Actinoplanes missouriensis]BAL87289.1 hypothetical protein AMIS_20690 [Actinoplanes missouriensis 431]